jgi:hypothetical protein
LRVHDPDDLQFERVEHDRVVPAVSRGESDGGRGPRLYRADKRSEVASLAGELIKQPGVSHGLDANLPA